MEATIKVFDWKEKKEAVSWITAQKNEKCKIWQINKGTDSYWFLAAKETDGGPWIRDCLFNYPIKEITGELGSTIFKIQETMFTNGKVDTVFMENNNRFLAVLTDKEAKAHG